MPLPTVDNVSNPRQWGYHARLDDNLLRLTASTREPFIIRRGPSQVQQVNTSENPDDYVDEVGRSYSQVEFTAGEGQRYAQRRSNTETSVNRFFYSEGLRINRQGDLEVVNQTEQVIAGNGSSPPARAAYDGTALYTTRGDTSLNKVTGLNNTTPTVATVATGASNPVQDITSLGGKLYVATGTQVLWNDTGPTTFTQWSDSDIVRIWHVKRRIIASDGRNLYEDPVGTGAKTPLVTLPVGSSWTSVVDDGEFVFATSSGGTLFSFGFDGTALSLTAETSFNDEKVEAVTTVYDRVLILTYQEDDTGDSQTTRLWTGAFGNNGNLVNLQVRREWENLPVSLRPQHLRTAERSEAFFAAPGYGGTNLWRYDSAFDGLISDLIFDGLTNVYATYIAKLQGRFWTVFDNGAVWREATTKRDRAVFVGPLVDFFTSQSKVWDNAKVSGTYPTSDSALRLAVSGDPDAIDNPDVETFWTPVKAFRSEQDESTSLQVDTSRFLAARIVFEGDAVLRSYALRSLPPVSDEEVVLNINISDAFARPGKQPAQAKGLGDELWFAVRRLQGQSLQLELFPLDITWVGTVLEVSTPVSTLRPRGGVTRTMQVLFRGERLLSIVIDEQVWGYALWGASLWGGTNVEEL